MPMFEYRCDGCRTRSEILVLAGDVVASGEGSGSGGMGGFDN